MTREARRRGGAQRTLWLVIPALSLALWVGCAEAPAAAPAQPIAFSHVAHAEAEDPIECARCHQGAESQAEAGLPPISSCAVCHRRRAIPDHPEVLKFMEALERDEPVIWRKVNVIRSAAMVHFRHDAHARAGVDCATCHGDVAAMTVAEEVIETADMRWCVNCHRDNGASVDCLVCHH